MVANATTIDWEQFTKGVVESYDVELEETFVDYKGHDPLLISCIQYRLFNGRDTRINMTPLRDELIDLLAKATDEDYQLVDDIKAYYTSKYMVRELQSGTLTSYKSNTLKLFTMSKDGYAKVPTKWVGIAFKLPFFYNHDIALDKMFSEHALVQQKTKKVVLDNLKLTYIQTISPNSKRFPDKHFWFKDSVGNMYLFKGKTPNPLLGLFESMLDKNGHVVLKSDALIRKKTFFNHEYYELSRPEFQYV